VGLWVKFKGGEGVNYSLDENFDHYVAEGREYFCWSSEFQDKERYHELCLNMNEVQIYQFNFNKDAEEIGRIGEREGYTKNLWKRRTESHFPVGVEPMCCTTNRISSNKGKAYSG
jgi:hypothetical protein